MFSGQELLLQEMGFHRRLRKHCIFQSLNSGTFSMGGGLSTTLGNQYGIVRATSSLCRGRHLEPRSSGNDASGCRQRGDETNEAGAVLVVHDGVDHIAQVAKICRESLFCRLLTLNLRGPVPKYKASKSFYSTKRTGSVRDLIKSFRLQKPTWLDLFQSNKLLYTFLFYCLFCGFWRCNPSRWHKDTHGIQCSRKQTV